MPLFCFRLLLGLLLTAAAARGMAAAAPADACPRPAPGAQVEDPPEVASRSGFLELSLSFRAQQLADGSRRYCYLTPDGRQSPTLRVRPGDEVILRLRNELPRTETEAPEAQHNAASNDCDRRTMTPDATNLHFHGLALPATCHADDVLHTLVRPQDPEFVYRFRVPEDEAPGLYWYHAHAHGLAAQQVGGGASGAMIVDPANGSLSSAAQGLRERVLVVRDQPLWDPKAEMPPLDRWIASRSRDGDGDAGNSGLGYGKPARDLSVNFVPVPYPGYLPAGITMQAGQREFWRVVNASAVTYLNLQLLVGGLPQVFTVVAVDGVPLDWRHPGAMDRRQTDHLALAPGARVEFIVQAPPGGQKAQLVTRAVDTGRDGENDPNRPLLTVTSKDGTGRIPTAAAGTEVHEASAQAATQWIGDVEPARVRRFYFAESLSDPAHPDRPAEFYLTEEGHPERIFNASDPRPTVEVRQGDVEDWIIENRTRELHVFHIHQLHFQLRDFFGLQVNEPFVRDTINVPYFEPHQPRFPSVRLRMDFRGPTVVGTFVYHCHLLDHEDAGMMGTIHVVPPQTLARGLTRAWAEMAGWLRARLLPEPARDSQLAFRPSWCAGARPVDAPLDRRFPNPERTASVVTSWDRAARLRFATALGIELPQSQSAIPLPAK